MAFTLTKITYASLKARQKEAFNYQKVSAALADYGFATIRLSDDWQGADFIAQHHNGSTFLKIQLKSRLTISKKYIGKTICIVFPHDNGWYLYEHDDLISYFTTAKKVVTTKSWTSHGSYSWINPPKYLLETKNILKL